MLASSLAKSRPIPDDAPVITANGSLRAGELIVGRASRPSSAETADPLTRQGHAGHRPCALALCWLVIPALPPCGNRSRNVPFGLK